MPLGGVWKFVWFRIQGSRDPDRENGHYADIYIDVIFNYRYNVVILLLTYIGPITIIAISTIHMSIVLWWRQPVSSINTPQLERAKRKKQKVRQTSKFIRISNLCIAI